MGTKTACGFLLLIFCGYSEKRIPKHGDENNHHSFKVYITVAPCEKRIPKHGDEKIKVPLTLV